VNVGHLVVKSTAVAYIHISNVA